jgi:hypothetical protein
MLIIEELLVWHIQCPDEPTSRASVPVCCFVAPIALFYFAATALPKHDRIASSKSISQRLQCYLLPRKKPPSLLLRSIWQKGVVLLFIVMLRHGDYSCCMFFYNKTQRYEGRIIPS